ncbi:MAG: CPBP family intramembrane metalloprotease [Lachnospiraceae bacterium]|nr:CPBP family intramembrane metalloprotease [Lachnospiraceae bacterium]
MNIKKINMMFLVTVLISLTASLLPLGHMFSDYGARLLFSEILLAAPGAAWIFAGKRNYVRTVRLKKIHGSTVVMLILFVISIMPLMSLINAISMLFVENSTTTSMAQVVSGHSFLVSLILIALLPAILEESVYRGLFYNEYRKVAPLGGLLLSAFLFGIMHANWNQFSYAFAMGMVFCLIIEATDSILSSMILHFCINGSSVVLLSAMEVLSEHFPQQVEEALLEVGDMSAQTLRSILRTYLPMALVGTAIAAVVFRQIAIKEGRLEAVRALFRRGGLDASGKPCEGGQGSKLCSIPLIVAIAILLVLMVLNEVL